MQDEAAPFLSIPRSLIELLTAPVRLDTGPYQGWGRDGQQAFVVELDAQPLLVLIQEAARGARIYELLSIKRPGDLLHYWRVRPVTVQPCVADLFSDHTSGSDLMSECAAGYLPFVAFDGAFHWEGDDTRPEAACWRRFRERTFWRELAKEMLSGIRDVQERIRKSDDYLIRREIARIDDGEHPRDFVANIDRPCHTESLIADQPQLPATLMAAIDDLIVRENVRSVSCPLTDYRLWRRLIEEQVRRCDRTGQPPQVAFTLSGPDGGLRIPYADWGGYIHIPYEGACGADLFIKPDWRRVFPAADARGGSLSDVVFHSVQLAAIGYVCHYLLTQEDLGQLRCASRLDVGDGWILYESNRPYEPNLLFKKQPGDLPGGFGHGTR